MFGDHREKETSKTKDKYVIQQKQQRKKLLKNKIPRREKGHNLMRTVSYETQKEVRPTRGLWRNDGRKPPRLDCNVKWIREAQHTRHSTNAKNPLPRGSICYREKRQKVESWHGKRARDGGNWCEKSEALLSDTVKGRGSRTLYMWLRSGGTVTRSLHPGGERSPSGVERRGRPGL